MTRARSLATWGLLVLSTLALVRGAAIARARVRQPATVHPTGQADAR